MCTWISLGGINARLARLVLLAMLATVALTPARAVHGASGQPLALVSIHFVSATTGWGVTDSAVVRTVDGGSTWHNVTPPGLSVAPLHAPATAFFSAADAWVADPPQAANPGIYRTTDGGRAWQRATLPPLLRSAGPIAISQLDFLDSLHGWALESLGGGAGTFYYALFRTLDGGATWSGICGGTLTRPPSPGAYPTDVQAVHFDSPTDGWTSVVIYAGPQLNGLYHSTDAGHTWQKVSLPLTGAFGEGFFNVGSPVFFDAHHGAVAVANQAAAGLYVTTNGGASWKLSGAFPATIQPGSPGQFSADILDSLHTWVIAGSNLYFTPDLGRHWTSVRQTLDFGSIASIDYICACDGWALGGTLGSGSGAASHSTLQRTTNGGKNWAVLRPTI